MRKRKDSRSGTRAAELELANRVHSAAIHLLRAVRKQDDRSGLSAPRLSALSVLVFRGATRLTDLAAAEQVRPPTMTRIVAALERDGLVERTSDDGDRRAVLLTATGEGVRLLHAGRRRRVAVLAAAVRALDREERAVLERAVAVLDKVVNSATRARA